jgi:hypothetical protein
MKGWSELCVKDHGEDPEKCSFLEDLYICAVRLTFYLSIQLLAIIDLTPFSNHVIVSSSLAIHDSSEKDCSCLKLLLIPRTPLYERTGSGRHHTDIIRMKTEVLNGRRTDGTADSFMGGPCMHSHT